jgi:drug/metabolite transporter (DMT)-like permease
MIWLIFSILTSSVIYFIFRLLQKYEVDNLQAVCFNYFVCVFAGFVFFPPQISASAIPAGLWIVGAITGTGFILAFYFMAVTTQIFGIATASIVSRMSLIAPSFLAIYLYGESFTFYKITGIAAGLLAIYLVLFKNKSEKESLSKKTGKKTGTLFLFPILVFIVTATVDSMIKVAEFNYLRSLPNTLLINIIFGTAAIIAAIILFYLFFVKEEKFRIKNLLWGALLGIFNYLALYFFLLAFVTNGMEASAIFPVNHVGIVTISTIGSAIIYKEKLNMLNKTGILVAILAIILIFY